MNKIIVSLSLLLFTSSAIFAQYIFQEDFQQGIPNTWTLINVDGLTPDSTLTVPSQITDAWVALDDFANPGDTFAASTSKYLPVGQANDWLITPAIATQGNSAVTWFANAFIAAGDGYEVRISTTTPTVNGFLAHSPLFSIASENVGWTKRNADLSGYANQTVYLAFRNNSINKFILGVDDLVVFDCNTLSADAGTIDTGTTVACSGFSTLNLGLSPSYLGSTPTTSINGNSNDVPNWNPLPGRPFDDDGSCCWGISVNPPYQQVGFQVTVSGTYGLNQTQSVYDGVVYIYTDPFDLSVNPPTTFIAGNDDDPNLGSGFSEITGMTLTQGVNYYLISTGYGTSDFGNYTTTFSGPGSLLLTNPTAADLPYDYNYVVSNSNGIIVSIGDDLTNTTTFPGSPAGDTFSVCGISYIYSNVNITAYIGLPKSVLENDISGNSCAELTVDCHTAVVLSGGTVDAGDGDTLCAGGTVTLTATGGMSYVWSTGDSTQSIFVSPPITTIYSVTSTNNIGCTATDDVTVDIHASDAGTFDAGSTHACAGSPLLILDLTPEFSRNFFPATTNEINGSTLVYFTWDPLPGRPFADGTCCSGNNPTFDVKAFQVDVSGNYSFSQIQLGYDGILFLYTDPFDLTANPPVTFIAANDDSSGNVGFSYLPSIPLQRGRAYYLVSAGFDAGNYGNYLTTITGPGNIMLPGQPDTLEFGYEFVTLNNTGAIIAFDKDLSNALTYPGSANGTDYQVCGVSYFRDSVNLSLYLGQPYSNLQGAGCLDASTDCHSVKIYTQPTADAGADDTVCFNAPLQLAASSPAIGIGSWSLEAGGGMFDNLNSPNATFTPTVAGMNVLLWSVNNGGCSVFDSMLVSVILPDIDAGEDATICRGDTITLTASSNSGTQFQWSTGQSTASIIPIPFITKNYSVTITDGNGCTASDSATVTVNPLPVVNITDATICPGSTTVLDAGNAGAHFFWSTSDTSQTIAVSVEGTFYVTVTNANSCVNSDSATVLFGSGLTVMLNDVNLCDGDSAIFDAGNPGANYTWSTGENTQTIYATDGGDYSVTVVDNNNCSGIDSAIVTVLQLPFVVVSSDEILCAGESATLTATGNGTLEWSTGDTTSFITVSPPSTETYVVTVTGGNACTVLEDIVVTVNPLPVADAGSNLDICEGESTNLSASGGDVYLWSTGDTTASVSITPTSDLTYHVTVTTSFGCSTSDSVTVTVRTAAAADAGVGDTICAGENTTLQASGGGTYLWENGNANSFITVSPVSSEYYSVTVTAPNGCQAEDSAFVQVTPLPTVDFGSTVDLCLGSSITLSVSGGDTYIWNTGDITASIDVSPIVDETYSVTASTNEGCGISASTLVTVQSPPTADAGPDTTICEGETIQLTASGGTDYFWSNSSSSNPITISPVTTRTYSVTVSSAAGCNDTDEVTVTVKNVVEAILFGFDTTVYCIDHAPINIAGSPTGGILSGPGVSNEQFNPATAGTGTHTITYSLLNPNGCSSIDSKDITVDPCNAIAGMLNAEVKIYPNPTENFIIIEVTGLSQDEETTVYLFDPIGRMLIKTPLKESMQLNLSSFASGIYLLQIRNKEGMAVKQVVKN